MNVPGNFFDMEIRTFKIDNYITVPGFAIIELGLSGNELLCYSLIYGLSATKIHLKIEMTTGCESVVFLELYKGEKK